jgi:glutathione S-transferase
MRDLVLVGRSSSHYTRAARIFALELGVPVLVDADGPLFGTENICRELLRRSQKGGGAFLRGDVGGRLVANVEETTLHAMSTDVTLVTAKLAGADHAPPPKVQRSLENALRYLDDNVDRVLEALPPDRTLTFLEVALFCVVTHLPFREVLDVAGYERLTAFCDRFADRESARQTGYRFDAA